MGPKKGAKASWYATAEQKKNAAAEAEQKKNAAAEAVALKMAADASSASAAAPHVDVQDTLPDADDDVTLSTLKDAADDDAPLGPPIQQNVPGEDGQEQSPEALAPEACPPPLPTTTPTSRSSLQSCKSVFDFESLGCDFFYLQYWILFAFIFCLCSGMCMSRLVVFRFSGG